MLKWLKKLFSNKIAIEWEYDPDDWYTCPKCGKQSDSKRGIKIHQAKMNHR